MEKIYALRLVDKAGNLKKGMYCRGDNAVTPELAKQLLGSIIKRDGDRFAVTEQIIFPGLWEDSAGNMHQRLSDPVVTEII